MQTKKSLVWYGGGKDGENNEVEMHINDSSSSIVVRL